MNLRNPPYTIISDGPCNHSSPLPPSIFRKPLLNPSIQHIQRDIFRHDASRLIYQIIRWQCRDIIGTDRISVRIAHTDPRQIRHGLLPIIQIRVVGNLINLHSFGLITIIHILKQQIIRRLHLRIETEIQENIFSLQFRQGAIFPFRITL